MSTWTQTTPRHWQRTDGAAVKFEASSTVTTRKPWAPIKRGWLGFGPGDIQSNPLLCRSRQLRHGLESKGRPPRRFKSAEAAMRAVDRAYPPEKPRAVEAADLQLTAQVVRP